MSEVKIRKSELTELLLYTLLKQEGEQTEEMIQRRDRGLRGALLVQKMKLKIEKLLELKKEKRKMKKKLKRLQKYLQSKGLDPQK